MQAGLVGAAVLTTGLPMAAPKRNLKKSLKMGMINDPNAKTIKERLQVAKNAGFVGVEPDYIFDDQTAREMKAAADELGLVLDAIICPTHWGSPLSDPDPKVVDQTMEGMEICLKNAKTIGADTVLLVPAVVTPTVSYQDAYTRSLARVKELAVIAERLGVTIGLENVWNKFLLSPLEFRRYIEETESDYVKAFFDIGNFLFWSYPQDWIRHLNELICHMDIKDFKLSNKSFVPLLEGDVPWKEVMAACDEIGYEGFVAAEVSGGDLKALTENVSKPMDTIFAM
jgi:hexulose-6-phosphate isomerase